MSDDAARLRALLEIAQLVGSARRLEDFIEVAADAARRALDAASLSVSRWDRETGMLRILCNVGQLGPGELRLPVDETYTIAGEPGSGEIKVNGAAARLGHRGDTIIVISYAAYDRDELTTYEPRVVHVDRDNRIIEVDAAVDVLLTA